MPSPAYVDGTAVYGSVIITFNAHDDPELYWDVQCDGAFTIQYGSRRMEQRNIYGEPIGAFAIRETPTARCTVYSRQPDPINYPGRLIEVGDIAWTATLPIQTWMVAEVETIYGSDDYLKQNLVLVKRINP